MVSSARQCVAALENADVFDGVLDEQADGGGLALALVLHEQANAGLAGGPFLDDLARCGRCSRWQRQ